MVKTDGIGDQTRLPICVFYWLELELITLKYRRMS